MRSTQVIAMERDDGTRSRKPRKAKSSLATEPGPLPPPGTCDVPSDWAEILGADFHGRVRYRRKFGCPTGLEPGDRVRLVIEQVEAFGAVALNQVMLGDIGSGRTNTGFDVTALLKPRNELCVDVELPRGEPLSPSLSHRDRERQAGGLVGDVCLEIHSAQ
jgi:hypothetical protein